VTECAVRDYRPGDEPGIIDVIEATLAVDPLPGISVADMVHAVSRLPGHPGRTLVATEDERIVGWCFLRADELFVHPDFRRRGHGRRIVEAFVARLRDEGEPYVKLHVPDLPAALAFRDALGFTYHSSMWLFELDPSVEVPAPRFPAGIVARTYRDDDLEGYARAARESFADHPTPLTFTTEMIAHSHGLPDFDPSGILVLFADGDDDTIIGWTKNEVERGAPDGRRRGFVSLIGVIPAFRGRGLGRELLRWAIEWARANGAGTIELNVEAANERALELYRRTGFTPGVEWRQYVVPTGAGPAGD
jgi:mycothiol synthase